MTDSSNPHSPTPEFKDYLARDLARSLRHEERFAPSTRVVFARRLGVVTLYGGGTVVALAIGLVLGNSTGYASARNEGARQRDEMAARAIGVADQLAAVRLDLSRARADLSRLAMVKGSIPKASLTAAVSELRMMDAGMERIDLDLTQNRAIVALPKTQEAPMKRAVAIACNVLALNTAAPQSPQAPVAAPQGVPVITLPAASARSTATVAALQGIHELADGRVLVNDARHRQLKIFDPTLATTTLVTDTASGSSNSYGPAPVTLIRFLGDSSLFPDLATQSLLVLDGGGQVARAIALPNVRDFPNFIISFSGVDPKGRLVYRGSNLTGPPSPNGLPTPVSDSAPILRVDLEQRRIDTIGRVKVRDGGSQVVDRSDPAIIKITTTLNPLPLLDEWSLTSDGSIALIRGHDYHVDWVHMDGKVSASPKLPFDWRRLTDDDKQKLIDSATAAHASLLARSTGAGAGVARGGGGAAPNADATIKEINGVRSGRGGGGDTTARVPMQVHANFSALKDITDFYPPLRRNGTVPDLDGNVWILPTTTAQSQNGELVYDVVNSKGELFERVRLPVGRSLAGFGKNGAVYLLAVDQPTGRVGPTYYLERTKLPRSR